jgi:hypothetical protein
MQYRQRRLHLTLYIATRAKARAFLRKANHARSWLQITIRRAEQNSCGVGEQSHAVCGLNLGEGRARRND